MNFVFSCPSTNSSIRDGALVGGVLLVRSGPVVGRTTFGCIPIIDTYPYGTHTYGAHTYGENTYGAHTYGTPYLRFSSSRIEDVAIAPGHVISGPRSACG